MANHLTEGRGHGCVVLARAPPTRPHVCVGGAPSPGNRRYVTAPRLLITMATVDLMRLDVLSQRGLLTWADGWMLRPPPPPLFSSLLQPAVSQSAPRPPLLLLLLSCHDGEVSGTSPPGEHTSPPPVCSCRRSH